MPEDFVRDVWEHGKAQKRYVVPEGMLKAALGERNSHRSIHDDLVSMNELRGEIEAALRWMKFPDAVDDLTLDSCMQWVCANGYINLRDLLHELKEWRAFRRMFLAPPSEELEEEKSLHDLVFLYGEKPNWGKANERIIEAFRRGQNAVKGTTNADRD
jgi:hypothetical protein